MPLGMAMGNLSRGYEAQDRYEKQTRAAAEESQYQRGMEGRKMALAEQSAAGEADLRKAKMDEIKRTAQKENFKETLMRMLTGDFRGGEQAYNKEGDRRMVEGSARMVDDGEGNQMITWIDEESQQPVVVDPRYAMLISGLKPTDLETIEGKREHEKELAGIKAGGAGSTPADIKVYNHILKNLKNPRTDKPYTPEEAWAEARSSRESLLNYSVKLASGYMASNPGATEEEAQGFADRMIDYFSNKYGRAPSGDAGGDGGGGDGGAGGDETARYLQGAKSSGGAGAMAGPHSDEDEELAM